ncbi:MAG: leucine-rich repeat domain-containing protein [Lachnospiraceae bacterium]|nr:leucine-rich repeat domain-containing protein [Lachnospiraceae bacterium]
MKKKILFVLLCFVVLYFSLFAQETPVQYGSRFREETDAVVSFMSFKASATDDDIKKYFVKNGMNYEESVEWTKSGESEANIYTVEDFSYQNAKFNYVSIRLIDYSFWHKPNVLDRITCKFLTKKDYDVFLGNLKRTYKYSDKSRVFYGKPRSFSDEERLESFSRDKDYVYYDEISCNETNLRITYNFNVSYECPRALKLPKNFHDGYEAFTGEDEISDMGIFMDSRTGVRMVFRSAESKKDSGNVVLYLNFEESTDIISLSVKKRLFTMSAEEAFEYVIHSGKPCGKRKEITDVLVTTEQTRKAHENFKGDHDYELLQSYLKRKFTETTLTSYTLEQCLGKDYRKDLVSVKIGDGITAVDGNAFDGCEKLESVEFATSVKSIACAFISCKKLRNLKMPDGLKFIGHWAFNNCENLENIVIPDGVESVESFAFLDCKGIKEIAIPKSLDKIGGGAFAGCVNLRKISVDGENENYCAENGILFSKDKKTLICCPSANGNLTIQNGIEEIDENAFYACESLVSVKIPDTVVKIGEALFYRCLKLEKVSLPKNLKSIPDSAFSMSGLREVNLPKNLEHIGDSAFSGCKMQVLTLPKKLKSIGKSAFFSCQSIKELVIPSGVQKIGRKAFFGSSVRSVAFEDRNDWYELQIKDKEKPLNSDNARIYSVDLSSPERNAMYLRGTDDGYFVKVKKD